MSNEDEKVRTPPLKPFIFGTDMSKSPSFRPLEGRLESDDELSRITISPSVSPLLLPTTEPITPIASRDDETAIFSDSDAASQNSETIYGFKSESRGRVSNRRRKSDSSEQSSRRSLRSSSAQREKVPQATKIFRNLLVLEESLRQQSRDQRILRRKFTSFVAILMGLEVSTVYILYFSNFPPSAFLKIILQFIFLSILVTLSLFNMSGEYRRTIIIPRKFFTSTNKGLRQLNLRLVKVKTPFAESFVDGWRTVVRSIIFIWLYTLIPIPKLQMVQSLIKKLKLIENNVQPRIGATDVKLVLNPRAFNSEIREAWEMYRDEFWARESSKRRHKEVDEPAKKVLDKSKLVENHRKQRRDRRKSKLDRPETPRVGRVKEE